MTSIGGVDWSKADVVTRAEEFIRALKQALSTESCYSKQVSADSTGESAQHSLLPSRVAVVGSFLLRTSLDTRKNIDIIAHMPASWCLKKHLDEKSYLAVRSSYLYFVSKHLTSVSDEAIRPFRVTMCASFGEKTCIRVVPNGNSESNFSIHIHACLDKEAIELGLKEPNKRFLKLNKELLPTSALIEKMDDSVYQCINRAEDSLMEFTVATLHQAVKSEKHLLYAIIFLKHWMFSHHRLSTLPGHILSLLVCTLGLHDEKAPAEKEKQKTSWEKIVRQTIALMASSEKFEDALRNIVVDNSANKVRGLTEVSNKSVHAHAVRNYPFTFRITKLHIDGLSSFAKGFHDALRRTPLTDDAEKLSAVLCGPAAHVSLPIAITRKFTDTSLLHFFMRHDAIISIVDIERVCTAKDVTKLLYELLRTAALALDERAVQLDSYLSTRLHANARGPISLSHTAYIGISYGDKPSPFSNITKGPLHGATADTSDFLRLWGSQNTGHRRFADGSVHITRVWKSKFPEDVIVEILRDVWLRHHEVPPALVGQQLSHFETGALLEENKMKLLNKSKQGHSERANASGKTADVSSILRHALGLLKNYMYALHENGFPVKIENLLCTHPAIRNTGVWAPKPHVCLMHVKERKEYNVSHEDLDRRYGIECIPITVDLGKHALWPHDVSAIEQLKSSLGVEICRIMRKQYGVVCVPSARHVTLIILGFAFRLDLYYKKLTQLYSTLGEHDRVKELQTQHQVVPEHHEFIRKIVEIHPAAGVAIRVLQRLVGIHLPMGALPEEAIELLVAKQFYPTSSRSTEGRAKMYVTRSPLVVLLETFGFILSHDWKDAIALFENNTANKGFTGIQHSMHFLTPYSKESPFTAKAPALEDLSELRSLAWHCLSRIIDKLKIPSSMQQSYLKPRMMSLRSPFSIIDHWKHWEATHLASELEYLDLRASYKIWAESLFTHYREFDFVLSFQPKLINRRYNESIDGAEGSAEKDAAGSISKFNIYEKGSKDRSEMLHSFFTFDPLTELLSTLHSAFPGMVKIYHDGYGMDTEKHIVLGLFVEDTGENKKAKKQQTGEQIIDKKAKLEKIVHLFGDAIQSYRLLGSTE